MVPPLVNASRPSIWGDDEYEGWPVDCLGDHGPQPSGPLLVHHAGDMARRHVDDHVTGPVEATRPVAVQLHNAPNRCRRTPPTAEAG